MILDRVSIQIGAISGHRRRGPSHPGGDVHIPQPIGERWNRAEILDDVPLGDDSRGHLPAGCRLDHRIEDRLGQVDPETVVQHGPVADVGEVFLGGVEELVQRQKIVNSAAKATDATLGVVPIRECPRGSCNPRSGLPFDHRSSGEPRRPFSPRRPCRK